MRVAVFRAETDGLRTAARLAERCHEAVLAPVLRIVPTGLPVTSEGVGGLIFTSAHAPESLSQGDDRLREIPCWCVGTRTAEAARSVGFQRVTEGGGNVETLARSIIASRPSRALMLVTCQVRKPVLEHALARAEIPLHVVLAYDAVAVAAWLPPVINELSTAQVALHYSRRSAELAAALTGRATLGECFMHWTHLCLSTDVAMALGEVARHRVLVASEPREASLLDLLTRFGPRHGR